MPEELAGRAGAQHVSVVDAVAVAVYAVNQAVDGVGIKFVADAYVAASPADKASALLVADAVRHIEMGLTSLFELSLGTALALFGLAIGWSTTYPTLLGWAAIADGIGWVVVAVLVASRGFGVSVSGLALIGHLPAGPVGPGAGRRPVAQGQPTGS